MPDDNRLPFELDEKIEESLVTAHAGVPLVIELFRESGAAREMNERVKIKQRRRGLTTAETAECLFALWSAGGDRCEDLKRLKEDEALAVLLGHEICPPTTARDFLEAFGGGEDLPLLQAGLFSRVPSEASALGGLLASNQRLLEWAQARKEEQTATLDVDASIYETEKQTAKMSYEGTSGYQPVIVVWAERDLIVSDEFRDGNVPAQSGNWRVIDRALKQLPGGVKERRVRGDSALYEHEVLRGLDREGIGYAITAVMSPELRAVVEQVPEDAWRFQSQEQDAVREWAEVEFFPSDRDYRKTGPVARRYLALRVLKNQGSLFADGSDRRHFAVVTNLDWEGDEIIRWHRKKAGTVEHVHDAMKNGLAAGAFPSSRVFGANAAWFRLNVMLYNLLSLLKREALPGELQTAKPKRLRFVLLNTVGRVIRHARETLLRVFDDSLRALYDAARRSIRARSPALVVV